MSDLLAILNLINDAIFVSLVNTTLQIIVVISLIALLIRVFRVKSAAIRYSLWLFALFAIIALPILTPFIAQVDFIGLRQQRAADDGLDDTMHLGMETNGAGELSEAGDSAPSAVAAKAVISREMDVPLINPVSIVYFIWCAGALFMLCMTADVYRKLRKLRVSSHDVEEQEALEMMSQLKQRLGVRRSVALKTSSQVHIPMSMGVFSPVIILPDGLIDDVPRDQLSMILTHELAHIKRCDYLTSLVQNIIRIVFFFHPLFHLLNRSLAREREHICDDWVIDMTQRRRGYAQCIVSLLEKALHKPASIPVTIAMAERKQDIPGRIDMIVDKKRKLNIKVSMKALIALSLIGCLALLFIGGAQLVRFAEAAEDEGKIVFTSDRDGIWDLYVMDADGAGIQRLTNGSYGWAPRWSPDGKKIAFTSSRSGQWEISVMDSDGANERELTNTDSKRGNGSVFPCWSPDGKKIIFTSDREWPSNIHIMDADGGNLQRLFEFPGWEHYSFSWSPDGKKIAFSNDNPSAPAAYVIYVIDADGANSRLLIDMPGSVGEMQPAWHPGGESLVFASIGPTWLGYVDGGTNNQIYSVDADGQNARKIADGWCPSWSPDGKRIVFSSKRDDNWDIYTIDADGQNLRRLTDDTAWDSYPHWWGGPSYAVEPAGKLKSTWGKIKALLR